MRVSINRNELVKSKGMLPLPKELSNIELPDKVVQRAQELILEVLAQSIQEDPKMGPFSMEGEDYEGTT